ncbi:unnamed protein product [Menidia menidia]|uniref:(Atlantic silverside) hypothetical protein n=1 Tax=Menidia menidia TaxID=238744 RepID=A0A8S4BJY3_9TELE|nr:unnamed protein product [Menidia menidia]
MTEHCVVHILGTEGHFLLRVTLTASDTGESEVDSDRKCRLESVTMETRMVMHREQEEQSSKMSQSMQLSSQTKKRTFTSREILQETMVADEDFQREKWTFFGNEAEKVEKDVIRNQHVLRTRFDKMALRHQAERKASSHMKYLEQLSQKAPDFAVPLRAHTVWEGMTVKLSCTVQGCPTPKVTWYKDGEPLLMSYLPWNYSLQQSFGLNILEIRRCHPDDAGEYKVVVKSPLGEAMTFGKLVHIEALWLVQSIRRLLLQQEAQFDTSFPPTWVKEGDSLTLQCAFTSTLLPFQQDISWFRDGIQLHQSSNVEIKTIDNKATITLRTAQKEHEGFYSARLRTWDGIQEQKAFVHVKDAASAVQGGPASPLAVQVSDVNKDYVFLTWQPPSADGASPVEGYYVEKCDLGQGEWVRCNALVQKTCHCPVFGLKEGTLYQFRVCAVNQAGAGRPSKATEPILTKDPLEHTRTMVVKVDRGKTITITKDDLEGQVKAPFPPTNVHACEVSDTYVVLSWTEPEPRGREPLTFYVEQPAPPHSVMAIRDTDTSVLLQWHEPKDKDDILGYYLYYSDAAKQDWKTVNNKPLTTNRFTVHGLKTRKEYVFRVKCVSRAGNSIYSEESQPVTVKSAINVPSSPSAIALLLCTGSEMVLGWRGPPFHGGDPVRGYFLDQREKGMEAWREVNVKPAQQRQFKVCNLTSGHLYQFRVFAANLAGVGKSSEPSEAFLCEKWTMPEPGCPHDLEFREVRNSSLVLLWAAPLYEGQSPVTGYMLEVSQGDQSENWTLLNEKPISDTHYKVSGLEAGQTYRLRVSAVNEAGVGRASVPSEPVTLWTQPGTKEIEIGVDKDGFIFLGYEAVEMNDESKFLWKKKYSDSTDAKRMKAETKNNRSVLTFTDPSEEDLGLYSVEMSDSPHLSSSYDFTAEDLERLQELSWQVRNPLIALKSGWQVEVSEKGSVRVWLQTESLSNAAELRLICNDREISSAPHRQINFDKAKGLVEILFDQLSQEHQGSYTAQLRDGRAKNQFTLVFVDQKFRETLALADANRRDTERKAGPYFEEFLTWSVNEDCELIIKCKVTNTHKDTYFKWFKDGVEVTQFVLDQSSGFSSLAISQVTKKDAGSYRAVVSDGRGEDVSTLELVDDEFDKLLQQLSKQCALSAGPLRIQSTAEGFKLYCSLKYYISFLKTVWYLNERRIDQEARTKPETTIQRVWIEIFNPTENDKGKYTLEMFDGKETHKRFLELSQEAFADALLEHQRLKQLAIAEKNRAKVTKGLPDVVAIMEGKSLCLTCFIDGEPAPEIFWLRNDREILDQTHFTITKQPKCSSITVNMVSVEDSGKYSIYVRNNYGSETVDVTVSVYKHGEKPPANAVEMG